MIYIFILPYFFSYLAFYSRKNSHWTTFSEQPLASKQNWTGTLANNQKMSTWLQLLRDNCDTGLS